MSASSARLIILLLVNTAEDVQKVRDSLSSLTNIGAVNGQCLLVATESVASLIPTDLLTVGVSAVVVPEGAPGARLNAAVGQLAELSSWVAVLLPGDRVSPDILQWLASAESHVGEPALLFADEDSLDLEGERCQPLFKTGWNPDAFGAGKDLGNAVFCKAGYLKKVGGFDESLPDANIRTLWYGVAAKAAGEGKPVIHHIPVVLLHRGSDDEGAVERQTRLDLAKRYLEKNQGVSSVAAENGILRVSWALPDKRPLVSFLIPTRDHLDVLKPCVESILDRTEYERFEVLIVDNQSRCPETLAFLESIKRRDERVRVLTWDHEFNFSAINNFGAKHARGELLALVNNDIEPLHGDWLNEMVGQARRPDIGCVGAKLVYPGGRIQHAGLALGVGEVAGHVYRFINENDQRFSGVFSGVRNVSAVTAACLVLRKTLFDQVGGMDEHNLPVNYNDVDLCLRVQRLGYRNLWTPYATLVHHESVSRGTGGGRAKRRASRAEVDYMWRTWEGELRRDPYYNPNLTEIHEDLSLRLIG
ncbi:glycosyltransferase family 2 protein [Marinobacter salinexigens]|uniref:glycosyltransferase family 2 protein n=1 Tax=Marinobacter salinexigens TaxID=2919747 RepID=UPI00165FD70B|nr:glycosyltransferase family 2 protein [Marinobacter salinexigens]